MDHEASRYSIDQAISEKRKAAKAKEGGEDAD
jgi:hypothetical protein